MGGVARSGKGLERGATPPVEEASCLLFEESGRRGILPLIRKKRLEARFYVLPQAEEGLREGKAAACNEEEFFQRPRHV